MSDNTIIASKKIKAILDKYNLKMTASIVFPIYKQLPDEVQLALKILIRHNMKIQSSISLKDNKK